MQFFAKENCEMAICLGDLIDHEESVEKVKANLEKVSQAFRAVSVPVIALMGNHDGFSLTEEDFYQILGDDCRPKTIQKDGKTLIFLDACYYDTGVHYHPELSSDWTNTFFPHLSWLKEEIAAAKGDVYVFMHQNIDPDVREDHCLHNAAEIRSILEESGKAKAVYQGHYHPGHQNECKGIRYVTFPAMCELENARFVIEI